MMAMRLLGPRGHPAAGLRQTPPPSAQVDVNVLSTEPNNGKMSAKESFDAHMAIAEIWRENIKLRRQYQVRFTLALWAAMAAAIGYIRPRPNETILVLMLIAICFGHAIVVLRAKRSDHRDFEQLDFWYIECERLLEKPRHQSSKRDTLKDALSFMMWFGPTVILAVLAYKVIPTLQVIPTLHP